MTELLAYRDRFPILRDTVYLINHSLAAMPAAAEDRLLEYARMWRERGIRSWGEGWWDMPVTVGDQVGRSLAQAAVKLLAGRFADPHPAMIVLALLFIVKYALF